MTPKEKANELLLKYDSLTTWISENNTLLQTQKQCALIAINESLEWTDNLVIIKFLNEVKKEIENL